MKPEFVVKRAFVVLSNNKEFPVSLVINAKTPEEAKQIHAAYVKQFHWDSRDFDEQMGLKMVSTIIITQSGEV